MPDGHSLFKDDYGTQAKCVMGELKRKWELQRFLKCLHKRQSEECGRWYNFWVPFLSSEINSFTEAEYAPYCLNLYLACLKS